MAIASPQSWGSYFAGGSPSRSRSRLTSISKGILVLVCFLLNIAAVQCDANAIPHPKGPRPTKKLDPERVIHPWTHRVFESIREDVAKKAHEFLNYQGATDPKGQLVMPIEINIALIGFDGTGAYGFTLDPVELKRLLHNSFPKHRPSCLETGKPLEVGMQLTYTTKHLGKDALDQVEGLLRSNLKEVHDDAVDTGDMPASKAYTMEAALLEGLLQQQYNHHYHSEQGIQSKAARTGVAEAPYVLFILNPDKRRLDPAYIQGSELPKAEGLSVQDAEGDLVYRYSYRGSGQVASWVGAGMYAVADISAGPCVYGRKGVAEGTVGPNALPRLSRMSEPPTSGIPTAQTMQLAKSVRKSRMEGSVAALVTSAVRHVFAPDIRLEALDFAERVLVPVIVLQNHENFDPLKPGHEHSIDIKAVEQEARKLVSSKQRLVMVAGTHSLHEHERLALAVDRSLLSRSGAVTDAQGKYALKTSEVLDSKVLAREMKRAADMLTSGIIGLTDPHLANVFFNPNLPDEDGSTRVKGTRVVPVYVLSLAGMPNGLLIDGTSLVAADHDIVIVLQNATPKNDTGACSASIELNFQAQGRAVKLEPRDPTRHIMAGLAMSLAGLVAPFERIGDQGRHRESFLWAAGHHPFGPFSNTSAVSQLTSHIAQRNYILIQADEAARSVRGALAEVDEFAREYADEKRRSKDEGPVSWLEHLHQDPHQGTNPLPHAIVERLQKDLMELEVRILQVGEAMYEGHMHQAQAASASVLKMSHTLSDYTHNELAQARQTLSCCHLEHIIPDHRTAWTYFAILLAGCTVYLMVILLSRPSTKMHAYRPVHIR